MLTATDHLLAVLLERLRRFPADRLRACRAAAGGAGPAFRDALAGEGRLPRAEIEAWAEACSYLLRGDHARSCAACRSLVLGEAGAGRRCAHCGGTSQPGVVPDPKQVTLAPSVVSLARKLVLDLTERHRARACVDGAHRLRQEGKVGQRAEEELAPKSKAVAEPTLGNYDLLALAGRGAHSYVYKARDRRTGALVALKVLYFTGEEPEPVLREITERFRRESALASKIRHPALLQPGPLEQTGPWTHLTMPFVDGPTLAHVLEARKAARPPGTPPALDDFPGLARSLCEIADGLNYAHCNGVIHRDVSPRNILFSADGQRVFLGDFGVAKVAGAALLTGKKAQLGERGYAAPERLTSEALVTPRSDVYSLGVILFEILTGRPPSDDPRGAGTTPRALNPAIPHRLEEVVLRAMATRPEDRYGSAQEFAEALDACAAAVGAEPSDETAPPPGARTAQDRLQGALSLAGPVTETLIALLLGLGAGWVVAHAAPGARTSPVADAQRALDALATAPPADHGRARIDADRELGRVRAWAPAADPDLALLTGRRQAADGRLPEAVAALAGAAGARRDPAGLLRLGLLSELLADRYGAAPRGADLRQSAHDAFFSASSLAPRSDEGRFAYAMLQLEAGQHGAAAGTFESLRTGVWRSWSRAMLVRARLGTGSLSAALAEAHDALGDPPDPVLALYGARALAAAGRVEEARQSLIAARATWPECAETAVLDARLRLANEPAKARDLAAQVLTRDPAHAEARYVLGAAWAALGDPCAGLADLVRAGADGWDRAELYFERGMLRARHGDAAGAAQDLRAFLARVPAGSRAEAARRVLRGG